MTGLHHRPDDEHFNVPTWRMRQLQDVEDAARQSVEMLRGLGDNESEWAATGVAVLDLLSEALGDDL